MNKLFSLLVLLAFFATFSLFSQEEDTKNDNIQTLLGDGGLKSGGYGGAEVKFLSFKDELGVMVGGRGGWILNSVFSVGGGGYGLVTNHKVDYKTNKNADVFFKAGWGGIYLEYINSSNNLFHFIVNTMIAWGSANLIETLKDEYDKTDTEKAKSNFFILEPGIAMELNISKNFRLSAGAGYRITSGLELNNSDGSVLISNKDLNGISANLILKYGLF